MEIIKCIILAIVQGLTEPLPISSSGHMFIVGNLLNSNMFNDLNFTIMLNMGSLVAIILYYRKDIKNIIVGFFKYIMTKEKKYYSEFRYSIYIVIASIPAGILGLLLKDVLEDKLSSIKIIGYSLLVTALFLFLIKDIKGKKSDEDITIKDAITIGLFQVLALIPGISRSGSTIVGGMFTGLKREAALKFSFMLYIPISIATSLLSIKNIIEIGDYSIVLQYVGYIIVTFVITFVALKWFIKYVKNGKLINFVYYCIIMGLFVIIFLN